MNIERDFKWKRCELWQLGDFAKLVDLQPVGRAAKLDRAVSTAPARDGCEFFKTLLAVANQPVIECDGRAWHSGWTARERDRLRQQHLETLGWRFHRIWSTDWFRDPKAETARIVTAWQQAVAEADRPPPPKIDVIPEQPPVRQEAPRAQ